MDSALGALLRHHRITAGLTQEALAEKAGLSGQAVGALERGDRRHPHRETVLRLADALGLGADERAELAAAAARTPRPRHAPSAPVRQLPAAPVRFSGREAEVAELTDLVRRPGVVVVSGMAGVGKTSLALHVAHRVAELFPDGQLYLDLRGSLQPQDALGQLLRALGRPDHGGTQAETAARLRSALAGRRVLLVLDDAATIDQVQPLLPGTVGCSAVVTSRRAMDTLPQARHLRLDVLPEREALDLLTAYAGPERTGADPAAAAQVVRQCGRLPLAVHLAGARLASRPAWPIAHLAHRLAVRRLDELDRDDAGIRASFAVSVDQLDPADQTAFTRFGVFGDVSLPVAARLLDVDTLAAELVLERLADLHLVRCTTPGRYRMHDLIRAYALERSADPEALGRVARLFVAVAWRSVALAVPHSFRGTWADPVWAAGAPDFATAAAAFAWLDEHRPQLVDLCRAPGVPAQALVRLATGLFPYYLSRGHRADWAEVCGRAAAVASDPPARAIVEMDLGVALRDAGHLRRSLALFRQLGDTNGVAVCLVNLSEVLQTCGDLAVAVSTGEESLALARELGLRCVEASVLEHLGSAHGRRGDHERELRCYLDSLRLNTAEGDDRACAGVLHRIGALHRRSGRADEAATALTRSLHLHREGGDPSGEAACLEELGLVHLLRRDRVAAAEALHRGLDIAERHGDLGRQASLRRHLAECGGSS
ncbi:Tetratricopeptide repeat-containing protein [Lentzea xinjiangensis]|uniref:Tetratricopeptide repeat-containing protein n=1 Tax=Lentzea xinjiangensis TaxID=402600 RepID=A0A1H9AHX5_9PSEU|nr:helix-turn-helix domain-containing protein [Lentzea xinjiangensis]SEP75568.1 Tetratricopeptide repeat-containing protein [Lentzea xinjiangensis]